MLLKLTVSGGRQDILFVPEKAAVGLGEIIMLLMVVSLHGPRYAINLIVKVPVAEYAFVGLTVVEVVPSPKSHKTALGVGVEVFVNIIGSFIQPFAGASKDAFIKLITTAFVLITVFTHPALLVTVSVTVKLPVLL